MRTASRLSEIIKEGRRRFHRLPILRRLIIGNSSVIIIGAVGGTFLTHYLTELRYDLDLFLIGVFAVVGILLSLFVNYWIVKNTLRPLHQLRESVDQVQAGQRRERVLVADDSDPDLNRLATAIDSMLARLDERTLQLRVLSEHAVDAQEEERKRIARGLHDDTSQALSMLIINLERLENAMPPKTPELRQRLTATRQLAIRTLEDLRKVIYGLRPTMLDDLGLVPAIRWYARSNLEEAGIQLNMEMLEESVRLPPSLETTLFRIAQEAINNIVRHANAKVVSVSILRSNGNICLRIEDDGHGFDVTQVSVQALRLRRLGLVGIRERMDLIGGDVTVESVPGQGTRLQVCVPILQSRQEAS